MLTLLCFSGFQTLIGQVDVKSLPVYFYVRFTYTDYHTANWPIPFELEMLNVGGAMDLRSGNSRRHGMELTHFHSQDRHFLKYLRQESSHQDNLYMYQSV